MSYLNEKNSKAVEISAVDCEAELGTRQRHYLRSLIATYKYQISVRLEKVSAEDRK